MKEEKDSRVFNFAKYTFPMWYKLWMWIFPTYEQRVGRIVLRYKKIKGKTYVTKIIE